MGVSRETGVLMETIYFRTLLAVVAAGSFSKAAKKLYITQSAVSRRIQLLEDFYGFPLLDREGAVIKPTTAGSAVLQKISKLLEIENDIHEELKSHCIGNDVVFCCTPAFGIVYLPAIMRRFMLEKVETGNLKFLIATPEDAVSGLQERLYDIAVIEHCDSLELKGFQVISLPDDKMVFVSSPSRGIPSPKVGIEKITAHRLYSRPSKCCAYKFLEENMKSVGKEMADFKQLVIMDDLNLIIECVKMGDGITFTPESLVKNHLIGGSMLAHRVDGFSSVRKRSLVFHNKAKQNPIIDSFMRYVVASVEAKGLRKET